MRHQVEELLRDLDELSKSPFLPPAGRNVMTRLGRYIRDTETRIDVLEGADADDR